MRLFCICVYTLALCCSGLWASEIKLLLGQELFVLKPDHVDINASSSSVLVSGDHALSAAVQFQKQAVEVGLDVREIDLSNPSYLSVRLADNRLLHISWARMGSADPHSEHSLGRKLSRLTELLRFDAEASIKVIDYTDVQPSSSPRKKRVFTQDTSVREVRYKVEEGESVESIAEMFDLAPSNVLFTNGVPAENPLQPGQLLILHRSP